MWKQRFDFLRNVLRFRNQEKDIFSLIFHLKWNVMLYCTSTNLSSMIMCVYKTLYKYIIHFWQVTTLVHDIVYKELVTKKVIHIDKKWQPNIGYLLYFVLYSPDSMNWRMVDTIFNDGSEKHSYKLWFYLSVGKMLATSKIFWWFWWEG